MRKVVFDPLRVMEEMQKKKKTVQQRIKRKSRWTDPSNKEVNESYLRGFEECFSTFVMSVERSAQGELDL